MIFGLQAICLWSSLKVRCSLANDDASSRSADHSSRTRVHRVGPACVYTTCVGMGLGSGLYVCALGIAHIVDVKACVYIYI